MTTRPYDLDALRPHLPADLLTTLDAPVVPRRRPRLLLVGVTNAGKTSLLRRLAVEVGVPVPERARVSGQPCTADMLDVDLGFVVLRDSPGGHAASGEPGATSDTLVDEAVDADHTVLLVGPGLWSPGDVPTALLACPARAAATTLVVSRIDTGGVDALLDPHGFQARVADKLTEVRDRIAQAGLAAPAQVLAVAADPGGMNATNPDLCREDFDADREWDGVEALLHTLRAVRPDTAGRRWRRDLRAVRSAVDRLPGRAEVRAAAEIARGAVVRLDRDRASLDTRLAGLAAEAGVQAHAGLVGGASTDAAWTAAIASGRDASAQAIGRWVKRMSDLAERLPEPTLDGPAPARTVDPRPGAPSRPGWAQEVGDRVGRFVQSVGDVLGGARSEATKDLERLKAQARGVEQHIDGLATVAENTNPTRLRHETRLADLTGRAQTQTKTADGLAKATTALKVAGALVELVGPMVVNHLEHRRAAEQDRSRDTFGDAAAEAVAEMQAAMLDGPAGRGPGAVLDRLRAEQARVATEPDRLDARRRALEASLAHRVAGRPWRAKPDGAAR
jgi:hypothetical protein